MKDKKITILKILIVVMIIVSVLVAIILMVLNNTPAKSEMGQVNSNNKDYIPNASDGEKIKRGEELFGNEICGLSEYIGEKLKEEEWNQGSDYEDGVHNVNSENMDIRDYYCSICGKIITSRPIRFELCIMWRMCENN